MIYYLYQLLFPNGKRYIGVSNNPRKRWARHARAARIGKGLSVHQAIRKYGWKNVKASVLVAGSREYILVLEIKAISIFNAMSHGGYNLLPGGEMSPMLVPAVAAKHGVTLRVSGKMRAIALSTWADPQVRARRLAAGSTSECREAKGSSTRGTRNSDETRRLKRDALLGRKKSAAHVEKIASKRRGLLYITDGIKNKMVFPPIELTPGWRMGMAPKRKASSPMETSR